VMFLHNFSRVGGGGSHGEWDDLAAKLQKKGYAVLSFDFRGFGDSKSVSRDFWKYPHNQVLRGFRRSGKLAESIEQKDFPGYYYPNLINDIAAARAFLDRKNDTHEVNTSNLILIGAGQGATLGALWMSAEMHRQKDLTPADPLGRFVVPKLDEPEGRDLAAAIWLTISPNLEGRSVSSAVKAALVDVARENKVPTAFFYGKNDGKAANLTLDYRKAITSKKAELKNTGEKAIPTTDLTGSKLLGERLSTTSDILKQLQRVMDDRGSKEWKKREEEKFRYFWTKGRAVQAKAAGEKIAHPIPLGMIGLGR
jgi:alpha-beta hydrolase superfamily lysophospholipase